MPIGNYERNPRAGQHLHRQLEKSMKQSEILTVQLEEDEQKKREPKNKQATLARVFDEAC